MGESGSSASCSRARRNRGWWVSSAHPGVGKSSLLRAGVLAALARGELPGSNGWRQLVLRPGERPHHQLTRALGGREIDAALAELPPGERLVLAVDQLEELFTSCEREDERAAFLEQLCSAASDPQRRALVLLALRGDYYTRFVSYPMFADLLSREHVLVGPMDRGELGRRDRAAGSSRRARGRGAAGRRVGVRCG